MSTSEVWYGVITSRGPRQQEPRLRVSDHPFFRGMNPALIEAAGQGSVDTTYDTGELLVREGEVADRFHLIFHGKVAVEVGGSEGIRRTVQTIGPGEVLGWSWISPPYLWQFDGRAVKETRVVSLDATVLRQALESRPVEGYRFLQRLLPVIGQRLENTRVQMLEFQDV
ncbi:MAG TPA: cyclic nucleotide-binding domain-containing protein [Thermoplasmata archaeon]